MAVSSPALRRSPARWSCGSKAAVIGPRGWEPAYVTVPGLETRGLASGRGVGVQDEGGWLWDALASKTELSHVAGTVSTYSC